MFLKHNMTLKEKCELLKELGREVHIFCDMDGVLAKWRKGNPVDEMFRSGYFINLELEPNVRDAMRLLIDAGFNCSALSAAFMNGIAEVEKGQWLDKYGLEEMGRLFMPCGVDKSDYVEDKAGAVYVLLDDYNFNLNAWKEANERKKGKYVPIKFLNGINGLSENWDGRTIYYKSNPEIIAHTIVDFVILN